MLISLFLGYVLIVDWWVEVVCYSCLLVTYMGFVCWFAFCLCLKVGCYSRVVFGVGGCIGVLCLRLLGW